MDQERFKGRNSPSIKHIPKRMGRGGWRLGLYGKKVRKISFFWKILSGKRRMSLTRYEPRIRQVSISVDRNDHLRGVIYLNIDYYVRATNNPNNLVFPYYLEEGIGELNDPGRR